MLTAAGEELVARARRVLVEVGDLVAAATRVRDPFSGTMRLGVIPTVAPYLLPEVTPHVSKKYPKLRLVFVEEKTEDVVAHLERGDLDAGLVALEADLGDVARAVVVRDPFVVALPAGHALAKKRSIGLRELEDENVLLLDDGHCMRAQALALCTKARAEESDFRATSLSTLAQMVSCGAGITLLPKLAVPVENRRGQLAIRPFVKPAPERTIGLVWRARSPFASAFKELTAALASAAKAAA
jgi:LysR family hydrogen peroxide-inducible transcriptional activator